MKFTKSEIKKILREHSVVSVNFTKKNGEERKMLCTLNPSAIPEEHQPKGTGPAANENQVRVYDVEAHGWRSFLIENVQDVQGC